MRLLVLEMSRASTPFSTSASKNHLDQSLSQRENLSKISIQHFDTSMAWMVPDRSSLAKMKLDISTILCTMEKATKVRCNDALV